MSFYRDKQIRMYCLFLTAFIIFLFVIGIVFSELWTLNIKSSYVKHDEAVASYLLEQGISDEVIANALNSTAVNEDGRNLLNKIGITEQTKNSSLSFVLGLRKHTYSMATAAALFLSILLFLITFVFLEKRKRLYARADKVIQGYISGNFSGHLPQNREGACYQLFTHIEQLAMTLQSKNETEHRTKEFLKGTISDISHQLKTPLAALTMYQEIIEDEPDNVGTVKSYCEKMGTALKRMERLIASMLKITRMDTGNIIFKKQNYSVSEIISDSVSELSWRAQKEGKELLMAGEPEEQIFCDREWTGEAIGNIVKNALDHTGTGNSIRITWEKTPTMLRIAISDNGSGIAPEDIHHIFKRFYRSQYSLTTQGIGLGLSLTKAIMEGQGGFISVQSELNEGTVFTLSFLTEM